jgi:trehalose 6-phosphate phosphatase
MADILAARNRATLAAFAAANVLLAFDYDGTLAPIAPTPARARMRTTTRQLLTRIAQRYPCVVISGRRLDDVAKRLEGIPIWYVFGNFGHEPAPHGHRPPTRVGDWARRLTERLPTHRGLVIEEKAYSVTIHYRHVSDKRRAIAAIEDAVSDIPDARSIGGTQALTLLPRGGPDKGVALQQARRLFHCDKALYIGDDDTDEDAFASAPPDRLLAIRVGTKRISAARYRLPRQAQIDRLLRTLLALRSAGSARSRGRGDEPGPRKGGREPSLRS